jgi:hypothetical protein
MHITKNQYFSFFIKVWWQDATLFVYFSYFITYIHSITFIHYIYPSPFAEASLHFLIACKLSGKNLPVVPSRESNSGLPYSKPTCYQLSHAAFIRACLIKKMNEKDHLLVLNLHLFLTIFFKIYNSMGNRILTA